jgi:hypothetical protein
LRETLRLGVNQLTTRVLQQAIPQAAEALFQQLGGRISQRTSLYFIRTIASQTGRATLSRLVASELAIQAGSRFAGYTIAGAVIYVGMLASAMFILEADAVFREMRRERSEERYAYANQVLISGTIFTLGSSGEPPVIFDTPRHPQRFLRVNPDRSELRTGERLASFLGDYEEFAGRLRRRLAIAAGQITNSRIEDGRLICDYVPGRSTEPGPIRIEEHQPYRIPDFPQPENISAEEVRLASLAHYNGEVDEFFRH